MKCFLYTMKDKAKLWLMSLPPGSLNTWEAVYNKFITMFYSHQKTTEFIYKIATFIQAEGEPFHEAWERFKMLLFHCPHHHYPIELQIQFFYDGLTQFCQAIVDNAAGGVMGQATTEICTLCGTLGHELNMCSYRETFPEYIQELAQAMNPSSEEKLIKVLEDIEAKFELRMNLGDETLRRMQVYLYEIHECLQK
ncbi:hypothetical protein ACOSQ4_014001 [Xanthoceras sorbifolium]